MRRIAPILVLVLLSGALAGAQDDAAAENPQLSHGELAVLLLKLGQPQAPPVTPEEALQLCKDMRLIPTEWSSEGTVTHGELADVIGL